VKSFGFLIGEPLVLEWHFYQERSSAK